MTSYEKAQILVYGPKLENNPLKDLITMLFSSIHFSKIILALF